MVGKYKLVKVESDKVSKSKGESQMLSVRKAAEYLGVSVPMVYKLITNKSIPAHEEFKPGRVKPIITIDRTALDQYIENVKQRRQRIQEPKV